MEKTSESKQKEESPLRMGSGNIERTFLTDMMKQNKEVNYLEKIEEYHGVLLKQVDMLDTHIVTVLQKHEQDFLNAFKCQMFSLYGQLKDLKKKNDENEIRLKRDEQLNTLQKSLDWFREEAVKLGQSTEYFQKEADKWKAKAESLQDDCNFLENQLKNTKRKLKLLEIEKKFDDNDSLASSMAPSQGAPAKFVPNSKAGEIIEDLYNKHGLKSNFLNELETYFHDLEVKYNESIRHLKNLVEVEKKKVKQVAAQQSSNFFVKSDLENLFLECVEESEKLC